MTMVIIAQLLTATTLVFFGASIWLQSVKDRRRKGLFWLCVLLALWIVTGIIANTPSDYTLFFNRLVFVFPLGVVISAVYLIYALLERTSIKQTWYVAVSSIMGLIVVATNTVVADVTLRHGNGSGYDVERGWMYPVYLLTILTISGLGLTELTFIHRKAYGRRRSQLQVVELGLVLTLLTGLLLAVFIPLMTGSSESADYSFLAGIIFVISFAFAIVKHGLFEVKIVVVRSAAYLLSLATLAAVYFVFAYALSMTFFRNNITTGISVSPINILLALLLAFIFQPVKHFFDKATNRIFFRDRYVTEDFYRHISKLLAMTTDLHDLIKNASIEIGKTLKAEKAFIYVFYNNRDHVEAGTPNYDSVSANEWDTIRNELRSRDNIIVTDLMASRGKSLLKNILEKNGIEILMPLTHGRERVVLGYLALGAQQSGGYTNRDLLALETISDELSLAIHNALSVQEIRDLNENLQARINEATRELRQTNTKLREVDATKDEFISMASHQLRTPLTSVKGYISMLLDDDLGRITASQRQALEEAFDSSQRMVYLIGDFLNLSRLQTGKFEIDYSKISLPEILGEEIDQLRQSAKKRNILLLYQAPEKFPLALADETKIRQVMMNFIDNAIYYSKPVGGEILITLDADQHNVRFCVKDNGIGVPKSVQKKLFTKFFRAENARKARPDGTGIGLYMSKRVILAHGGSVIFNSQENSGSEFGFSLPIKRTKVK